MIQYLDPAVFPLLPGSPHEQLQRLLETLEKHLFYLLTLVVAAVGGGSSAQPSLAAGGVGAPRQAPFLTRRSDGGKLTLEVSSSQFEEIILDVNKLHRSFHLLPPPSLPNRSTHRCGAKSGRTRLQNEATRGGEGLHNDRSPGLPSRRRHIDLWILKASTATDALASQVAAFI
jgi:hypothetical protein